MSIVFSEKTRRPRLALRWPFSRQITLSAGTLLVLLAVWWAVAAQQWVSPLFLPPPGQVLAKLITIAGPQGFMDATLWQHLGASLARILVALLAAVVIGIPVGIAMGLSPTVRGILDPLIEFAGVAHGLNSISILQPITAAAIIISLVPAQTRKRVRFTPVTFTSSVMRRMVSGMETTASAIRQGRQSR